jgi:hypothetical protein
MRDRLDQMPWETFQDHSVIRTSCSACHALVFFDLLAKFVACWRSWVERRRIEFDASDVVLGQESKEFQPRMRRAAAKIPSILARRRVTPADPLGPSAVE